MTIRYAALSLLALAACGQNSGNETAANTEMVASPAPLPAATPTAGPAPATTPASAVIPGTTLPPSSADPRYAGRWATDAGLCRDGAWVFRPKRLDTAGEVSCTFDRVATVPGGYDIDATCTAEAPPKPDRITLRFAESAKAMLVESKTFRSVGLIYCGPLE